MIKYLTEFLVFKIFIFDLIADKQKVKIILCLGDTEIHYIDCSKMHRRRF